MEAKRIGPGNVFEELLLEDLCEFMVVSGVKAEDPSVPGMRQRRVVVSPGR